jgi:hypothetical protein
MALELSGARRAAPVPDLAGLGLVIRIAVVRR